MRTARSLLYLALLSLVSQSIAAPIHDAAAKGDLTKVKALLAKDAKLLNIRDASGAAPLHFAVAGGHKALAGYLLSKKADVNAKKTDGVTPLHIAAAMDRMEIADMLLLKGADINASNVEGRTPLSKAVTNTNKAMVQHLLKKGANPDIADAEGKTPLKIAMEIGLSEIAPLFPGYEQAHKEAVETDLWHGCLDRNTIKAYRNYIAVYPSGRFASEAQSKAEALVLDDAPYSEVKAQESETAYEQFLEQYPGHRREPEVLAALELVRGKPISDLLEQKKIEASVSGKGIENVSLTLKRLVGTKMSVIIPVGTFFVSNNAGTQNMVVRKAQTVLLDSDDPQTVTISAACANRSKHIPEGDDSFSIQESPAAEELTKLMPVLDKTGVSYEIEQAAIWIITDDASYDDLGILVRSFGPIAIGGTRIIGEREAARAMQIIDQAGIDITKKAIWQDRSKILEKLPDGDLKTWLRQKANSH